MSVNNLCGRFVGLLLLLFAVFLTSCAPASEESDALAEARDPIEEEEVTVAIGLPEAPDFALPTLDGETFRLSDQEGRVVVLNFWATWCAPCRQEMPGFVTLQEQLDRDVRFVGVSLDKDGVEAVAPFAEELGINYPLVLDPEGSVAEAFGGHYSLPTTFLIDRRGHIRQRLIGRVDEAELGLMLRPLIDEDASS